ncbi:MAG: hypothetical protein ABSA44_09835 [Bacteroidota bacterium]|jgi:hypothetical protein
MAIKLSITARNARLDAIETAAGATAKLSIRTGTAPADCATADSGTLVISITLPSDWMNAAATGVKTKLGTWSGPATGAMSTAGHFRIYANDGTTCHIQGTASISGDSPDMVLDNNNIAIGQTVTVSTFTLTDANA